MRSNMRKCNNNLSVWKDYSRPLISVIVPARDESVFIGKLLSEIKDSLKGISHEILVINDGSKDNTAQIASSHGVNVISHAVSFGKGNAMKTGIRYARGSVFVFIDGDGAHNPGNILAVVNPIFRNEADLVIGTRRFRGEDISDYPKRRRINNILASQIISAVILLFVPLNNFTGRFFENNRITDCACGFRAVKRACWEKLDITSKGFEIEAEMIYEAAKNNLIMKEVPIDFRWDDGGSHLRIVRDGFKTLSLLSKKLYKDRKRALKNHGNTDTVHCRH